MPEDFVVTSDGEQIETVEEAVEVEASVDETPEVEQTVTEQPEVEETVADNGDVEEEFVEKKKEETSDASGEQDEEEKDETEDEEAIVDSKKKRCSLEDGDDKLAAIEAELEELRAFKRSVENKEKDALIDKYHMLSDEEKADVVAHKEEYTLEQIDEKLALIYVRNNVDFSTIDGHPVDENEGSEVNDGLLSFSLNDGDNAGDVVDEIQQSLREMKNY